MSESALIVIASGVGINFRGFFHQNSHVCTQYLFNVEYYIFGKHNSYVICQNNAQKGEKNVVPFSKNAHNNRVTYDWICNAIFNRKQ